MVKLKRFLAGIIAIITQICIDIAFAPAMDQAIQSGLNTLNEAGNPLLTLTFLLMFNIIGIAGGVDLISQIYTNFKDNLF